MFSSAQLLPHQPSILFHGILKSTGVLLTFPIWLFFILSSPVTCYWKLASFSWKSAGNCSQCEVLWRRQPVPSHCMYTPTHAGLELTLHLMSDLTGFYTSFFIISQTICTPRFFLSAHTQFMETAMLGPSETCSGIACIYQLLVMLFTSQFCFQKTELSCCIAIINFLCIVNQH